MLELRFFEFSSKLVPSFTILNAIFIIYTYLFLDGEEINILEFLKNNLFYLAPVLILVFAISYNIVVINEKGITWRSYIFPFLKKSFKWEKIKFHAKVLEDYNLKGFKKTKKVFWIIDVKDRLLFRLIDNYQHNTNKIFDITTNFSKKQGITLTVKNPIEVRNGFSKVKYPDK